MAVVTAVGDVGDVEGAGVAVEQGRPEQEEGRAERAEQEVLERGLLGQQAATTREPAQQVERQREHLERHEHGQQVTGSREQQHADDREQGQREDLAGRHPGAQGGGLVGRAGDGRTHRRERVGTLAAELLGHGEHAERGHRQDRALEEQCGAVDDDRLRERATAVALLHRHRHEDDEGGDQRHQREAHLDGVAQPARRERLDEDTDQRTGDDDEHRGDGAVVDVGSLEGRRRCESRRQGRRGQDRQGGHYFVLPSAAEVGAGSVTPTNCRVLDTAGLSMSSAGFG